MKNQLPSLTKKLLVKVLLPAIISLGGLGTLSAQVNFTQTLNADFNKGVVNNAIVAADNVSLQFSASDVGSWLTTTVLPQTLAGHRTASWNDRYTYLVGGYNNLDYVNTVYVATIQAGGITGWTALNPLPVALRDPAVVIGTNTIYVMGGRNGTQVYNTIYYAAINTDGTIGAWQTSAVTLPANLWGHTATYMMGYIYVIGGSSSMTGNTALNTVYSTRVNALNTLSSFTTGTNLAAARNRHSTVTYNNKIYVLGGYDNAGTKANSVYIATPALNGATGAWTSGTNLPVAVSNHSSVVTNGIITVMAGAVGSTLSNTVYYANADAGTLAWSTSANVMYDFTKDGSAFTGNGQVYYTGGTNLSGTPIFNCRYANMVLNTNYIAHGVFVSVPFYELGAERYINTLTFNKAFTAPANLQVTYRTAGSDGLWSDWATLVATSPITVNLTKQYLQYAVVMTGSTINNSTFNDMMLTTPGTQLAGNLNATTTFTKALSPYWATSDISFTAGTHTFQAGATILFLPETGLSIGAANVVCNGTAVDSVKFLYFTTETGKWDGLYFDENSDAGVSSQFYYTVISNAGFGANNANLYCYASNEPLLSRCNIRNADGNGINLNSAHINIQNSVIKGNTENGLYLTNSNPTLVTSALSYNGGAGVYYSSAASNPNFSSSGTTIDHNMYALRYPSPNFTFYQPNGSPSLTANTYNGIAINAGDVNGSNCRWNSISYDYILLGVVRVIQSYGNVRLTIEPGNTIKGISGAQIQIGTGAYGGELYALGTVDSLITFTSHNGLAGGWNGIYFTDNSDQWGGISQLDYCVIEKGNDYNYLSETTEQPNLINHCKIQNSLTDGARYNNAAGSITNCQFLNNGRYPLYFLNPEANPVHTGNTYTGNGVNRITLSGGNYNGFDRTITNEGIPYYVLNDTYVMASYGHSRLTINPGVTLEFAAGKKLQIGQPAYGGDLYAQGTSGSPIVFKAYNNTAGGWAGIYFHDHNDAWGGTSVMEYCTIKQGATYNMYIENSAQPSLSNCIISNSALHGIVEVGSTAQIHNCQFLNNNGYPLKYNDWTCNSHLLGNSYSGNNPNYIALSGGDYTSDRILYNDGIPYHVLGDIKIISSYSYCRLTLEPGITLAFNPGFKLQVGQSAYGGDLYAEGNADSIITLKPYNNTAGGWAGIYFHDHNDQWGGTSSLKYCTIDKGATYNLNIENSTQPSLSNCIISNSALNGIVAVGSSAQIHNCQFLNNAGYPLKFNDWTCNSHLQGNTYTGNTPNYIAISGGDYTSDRTLYNDGIPYQVFGDIRILQAYSHIRLTLQPGVTLAFNPGLKIQVGQPAYGGDLYAEGTSDSVITFKPYNNATGGWAGIYFHEGNDNWGGTSSLKYCSITKGANYNVNCESSTQPTIDHCSLTLSTGNGINIISSSLTIKNSTFTYNTGYGINIDGSGSSTIGNTPAFTCNILNNYGTYDLYNNTANAMDARYNFWGSGDSTMAMYRIFDKLDNAAKGRVIISPFAQAPSLTTATTVLSGNVKYANTGANPMKNTAMVVKNFAGTTISSTTTNTSGVYAFPSMASGNYKMTITPSNAWGGVNSTDALNIMNHFAQITPLTGMKLAAADVNFSHSVNGTDALLVMERYSAMITSFAAGDYLYNYDTVIMNGSTVTGNIEMLCFGDVNATYAPAKKSSSSTALVLEGSLTTESFTEFEFPVKLKTGMQLGAISLGFYYPEQYLEITGAKLMNGANGFSWTATDGLFRMGWCDMNALNVNDDDVIVILKMKARDLSGLTTGIALNLFEDCELADGSATPNESAILSIPLINTTLTSINPVEGIKALSVYPNPVTTNSVVEFSLEKPGNIRVSLFNILGTYMQDITKGDFTTGNHKISLHAANLKPGIYILKIENTTNGLTHSGLIRIVVSN